jgi:hypothetical protein
MPDERTAQVTGTGLVDLLDRVVDTGVALSGDLVISLADVDLIRLDLRLLLVGVAAAARIEETA